MKRSPLKRTELRRNSPSLLRGSGLAPASPKRAKQNAAYSKLRRQFLTDRPICEYPLGCQAASTDVHHKQGRVGSLLLDTSHWTALCRPCHDWAGAHPSAAYAMGLSERRIGGAT